MIMVKRNAIVIFIIIVSLCYGTILYVDIKDGEGNCTYDFPCNLETALDDALDGDTIDVVKVDGLDQQFLSKQYTIKSNIILTSTENVIIREDSNMGDFDSAFNFSYFVDSLVLRNIEIEQFQISPMFDDCEPFDGIDLTMDYCYLHQISQQTLFGERMSFKNIYIENTLFENCDTIYFEEVNENIYIRNSTFTDLYWSPIFPRGLSFNNVYSNNIEIIDSIFTREGLEIISYGFDAGTTIDIINSRFSHNVNQVHGGAISIFDWIGNVRLNLNGTTFYANCAKFGSAISLESFGSAILSINDSNFDCNGGVFVVDSDGVLGELEYSGIEGCPTDSISSPYCQDFWSGQEHGSAFFLQSHLNFTIEIDNSEFTRSGVIKSYDDDPYFFVHGTLGVAQSAAGSGRLEMRNTDVSKLYRGYPIELGSFLEANVLFDGCNFFQLYGRPYHMGEESPFGGGPDSDPNVHQVTFPFHFNSRSENVAVVAVDSVFDSNSKLDYGLRCMTDYFYANYYLHSGLFHLDGMGDWEMGTNGIHGSLTLIRSTIQGVYVGDDLGGCITLSEFEGTTNIYISDTNITGCTTCGEGGALVVMNDHSVLEITNSSISNSFALFRGGCVAIVGDVNVEINSSTFSGCNAEVGGGAIYGSQTSLEIKNCVFEDNIALDSGGAILTEIPTEKSVLIKNCSFFGNIQGRDPLDENIGREPSMFGGGAISLDKTSSDVDTTVITAIVEDCVFDENVAWTDGGDIYIYSGHSLIRNNFFSNSRADRHGGNIYAENARVNFTDNEAVDAVADSGFFEDCSGGSIYFFSERTWTKSLLITNSYIRRSKTKYQGGGVFVENGYALVRDSVFENCFGVEGGCFYIKNSKLYFSNQTTNTPKQVCVSDNSSGIARVEGILGETLIQGGQAQYGGGLYLDDDSLVQNYQNVTFRDCVAVVGGAMYLINEEFYPGTTMVFEENNAMFGAAIAASPGTPSYEAQTDLETEMEDRWFNCLIMKNNNGSWSNSLIFFLGDQNGVIERIWQGVQCMNTIEALGGCMNFDWGSTPKEVQRVEPDDRDEEINEDVSQYDIEGFDPNECCIYQSSSFMKVYSEETFDVVLKLLDQMRNPLVCYPSLTVELSVVGEGAVVITATDSTQPLVGEFVEFPELSLRGATDDIFLLQFNFELFQVKARHNLVVQITECPIGKEPLDDSDSCRDCQRGFYKFLQSNDKCLECDPFGNVCDNNVVNVNQGYWATLDTEEGTIVTYQCINNYCDGGTIRVLDDSEILAAKLNEEEEEEEEEDFNDDNDDDPPPQDETTTSTSSTRREYLEIEESGNFVLSENDCLSNRDGSIPLCAGCEEGYIMMNDECKECPSSSSFNIIPFSTMILLQIVLFLYVHVSTTCTTPNPPKKKKKKKNKNKTIVIYDVEEKEEKDDNGGENNSVRLLVDYIQMCFIINNFGTWLSTSDHEAVGGFRTFFVDNLQFVKNLFLFNPSVGGTGVDSSDYINKFGQCPFHLQGEYVLFWKVVQQFLMIVICLLPFLITCYCDCNFTLFKCCCWKPFYHCIWKKIIPSRKSKKVVSHFGIGIGSEDVDVDDNDKVSEEDNYEKSEFDVKERQGGIETEETEIETEIETETETEEEQSKKEIELKELEEGGQEETDSSSSSSSSNSSESKEKHFKSFNFRRESLVHEEHTKMVTEKFIEEKKLQEEEKETEKETEESEEESEKVLEEFGKIDFFESFLYLDEQNKKIEKRKKVERMIFSCFCCCPSFICKCFSFGMFRITLINLMFMIHTPLIMVILDFMFCSNFEGSGMRMIKYSFIECYTVSYMLWMFCFFLPLLCIAILFPIIVTCWLCCNRRKLNSPSFKTKFGVFYQSYRTECFWYESVIIFEKILLMMSNMIYNVIKINNPTYIGLNHTFHSVIIAGCILVHQVVQPFSSKFENRIQFLNLFSLLIMIGVQEEYYADASNIGYVISIIMFITLIWLMGCCCFCRIGLLEKILGKIFCCCCKKKKKKRKRKGIDQEVQTDEKDDDDDEKDDVKDDYDDDVNDEYVVMGKKNNNDNNEGIKNEEELADFVMYKQEGEKEEGEQEQQQQQEKKDDVLGFVGMDQDKS